MLIISFESILYEIANKEGVTVVKEYKFADHLGFKYRFDYAIIERKIAFEIEGGVYIYGRHNSPIGYTEDVIKYNLATLEGWRVYRFTTEMLRRNALIYPTSQKPNRGVKTLSEFLSQCFKS